MEKFILVFIFSIFMVTLVNGQCETNDLVYPSNTIQEGIYKTDATIESAGSINNQAKFLAADRITLKSGFSVEQGEIFKADNTGCNYLQNYTIESKIDPYPCLIMTTPNTYTAAKPINIDGDEGGWFFNTSNILENSDVYFSAGEEGGSPDIPITLTEPLPAVLQDFNQTYNKGEMIYSASENGQINGVLYYNNATDLPWEREALYFHLRENSSMDNYYKETLLIRYPTAKHNEVVSILETIRGCVSYSFAEINWQGTIEMDSCSYIIDINNYNYGVINPQIIDPVYMTNTPTKVFISHSYVPGWVDCGLVHNKIFIESITDLSDCTAVNYNLPFTAQKNMLYCFPDGQSFFIEDITNQFCPYCVADCIVHGELMLDLQVVDASDNIFSYIHQSLGGADVALPNGWTISIPVTGNESGCDYITEVEMTINKTNTTFEEDLAALQQMRANIEAIAESEPCTNAAYWSFTAIGSKACGGPQGYIAYSNNIDVASFLDLVEAYTLAEQAFNIKWGIFSTCDLALMPNGVSCVNGEPVFN